MQVVLYSAQAENLFECAVLTIQSATWMDEIVPHLLTKQHERLFGLYDSSLLGVAYQAFNWTADEEYNELRRQTITADFAQAWQRGVFFRDSHMVHLLLKENEVRRWLILVQSIASRPAGETNLFRGEEYTVRSQFDINTLPILVTDHRLELFRAWKKIIK